MPINPYYMRRNVAAAGGLTLPNAFNRIYKYNKSNTQSKQLPSQTQLVSKRTRKTGPKRSFTQKLLANLPAKHFTSGDSQTAISTVHNTMYTYNCTAAVLTGASDFNRIGDTIHLEALKINALFSTLAPSTAPCMIRVIVCYSGEEFTTGQAFVSGFGTSDIFLNTVGGISWIIAQQTNPKAVTVLDDRIITLNEQVAGQIEIEQNTYTVQLNQEFPYDKQGSTFGKFKNLYVVLMSCIKGGVTGTTAVAQVNMTTDLIFKDK